MVTSGRWGEGHNASFGARASQVTMEGKSFFASRRARRYAAAVTAHVSGAKSLSVIPFLMSRILAGLSNRRTDMTDQNLIQSLCDDLTPVRAHSVERQLFTATAAGSAVSFVALTYSFGIQPALGTVAGVGPLLVKLGYTLTLAGLALGAVRTLARPGGTIGSMLKSASVSFAILGGLAGFQLVRSPDIQLDNFLLGGAWNACPFWIATLSLPLLVALLWSLRRQAPVRLRAAGGMAGLASGALAAAIYAFACAEASAGFVMVWYSLGIAISTAAGAALGPRLLRW